MSNPAFQARAQALNARMEGEARIVLDEIEKKSIRKVARSSYACVVECFDKAGTTAPTESLDQCSRNCQAKYQQANAIVQDVSCSFLGTEQSESIATPPVSPCLPILYPNIIETGNEPVSEPFEPEYDGVSGQGEGYGHTGDRKRCTQNGKS